MSTLAQLYTRIILDTNRDDLGSGGEMEQAKIDAVVDAVEEHADELFWFNGASGTVSTVAATATVALPNGMRTANVVTYQGLPLQKARLPEMQGLTETGLPSRWAPNDGTIQFWPIPNAVYALSVFGIAELGVPTSSNEWTVEGYRLILATAKKILYRGPLRDVEGAALARDEEEEALTKLRRETRRRASSSLTTDLPTPSTFNINRGW